MKVAITGGARGIGAATATTFAAAGHDVTVLDILEPTEPDVQWIKVDFSDTAAIDSALEQMAGPYDAIINNAGVPPRPGQATRVLTINFFGLQYFFHGSIAHLAKGGSIVNVASRAGAAWRENLEQVKSLMALDPQAVQTFVEAEKIDATRAYNLSKEAVIAFTIAQTERLVAQGYRVNSVSPAAVDTDILDDFKAAFGDKVAHNLARSGRAGSVQEIANVIAFLASPESHWIKGQDLVIDGGMTAMATRDQLNL